MYNSSGLEYNRVMQKVLVILGGLSIIFGLGYMINSFMQESENVVGGLIVLGVGVFLVYCGENRKKLISD